MKMNGKKTKPVPIFFSIIGPQRYSHLSVSLSRWTGPRIFFEMSKVELFIVFKLSIMSYDNFPARHGLKLRL